MNNETPNRTMAAWQLPDDYIDPSIQGYDRELLEVFYKAQLTEGGSVDECVLRGLRAVVRHVFFDGMKAQAAPANKRTPV